MPSPPTHSQSTASSGLDRAAAGRIAVGANSFCDSFHGDEAKRKIEQNHAGGIVLNGATDVAVTGNIFSGLSTDAIAADAAAAASWSRGISSAGGTLWPRAAAPG